MQIGHTNRFRLVCPDCETKTTSSAGGHDYHSISVHSISLKPVLFSAEPPEEAAQKFDGEYTQRKEKGVDKLAPRKRKRTQHASAEINE